MVWKDVCGGQNVREKDECYQINFFVLGEAGLAYDFVYKSGYYELVIFKFTKLSLSSEAHIVRNNTHIGEIFLFVFGNFIHV